MLINEQAGRLTTMVEHTLQFAGFQARSGGVVLGEVDVASVINTAIAIQHLEIRKIGAEVAHHA